MSPTHSINNMQVSLHNWDIWQSSSSSSRQINDWNMHPSPYNHCCCNGSPARVSSTLILMQGPARLAARVGAHFFCSTT